MTTGRRERKVVSVVFCDMVGFTAQVDASDPEDVEALLLPYHERVRSELERHGGTVEKFIGDAVMALFGAPVAHEDDAERAIRACLSIRDWATGEREIQLRLAVTTGEALIRLDATPEGGMASGDVVATAARLQSAAPVNGILADETTYRATRRAIEYADTAAVEAKGKATPIAVWEVVGAHTAFGAEVAHQARTELIGRERELGVLRDAFERACHQRVPQLVTLVGVPGMGKSRLVHELSQIADAETGPVLWRKGRCLAYGDGVTLWALAEIVKAQAGILEQDTPAEVREKAFGIVADLLSGSGDQAWVDTHVRSLLGLGGETELGGDRRSEAFAAWRRLLEALAERTPLVLVFEDLHWADDALLDFVDELCDWVTEVPLLVVATARPELLERRAAWGGGKLNATTLALGPLTEEQTALLVGRLLGAPVMAAEAQQALIERSAGNPLYAEQFADLFLETGSVEKLQLPETLQGIIAARLDGLTGEEKALLQNASVVGDVFWASALGAVDATPVLHALERKGFVQRQRRSAAWETEYAFSHPLVREVAYGQIPRGERGAKHRGAAKWIEDLGRSEDHAELLAYHWRCALELARAAGHEEGDLADRARLACREAGDRAFALNAYTTAEKQYDYALELWPETDPERSLLLFRRAHALVIAADPCRVEALDEARAALLGDGDRVRAGEAEALLAQVAWREGRHDEGLVHLRAAQELVEGAETSVSATRVLAVSARYRMLAGQRADGLSLAEGALAMAEELGLEELRAHALITIGTAKFFLGDEDCVRVLESALEIALAADSPIAANALNNLGVIASTNDHRRERALFGECFDLAERMGDREGMRFARGNLTWSDWALGRWDEALVRAEGFIAECETGAPHYLESSVRTYRASIRFGRGEIDAALEELEQARDLARRAQDPQAQLPPLCSSVWAYAQVGRLVEARAFGDELIAILEELPEKPSAVCDVAPFAEDIGLASDVRVLVELTPSGRSREAARAALDGDHERAADILAELGDLPAEADARVRAAKKLVESGRRDEAEAQLDQALAFYRSVDATLFIERGEALLPERASRSPGGRRGAA
jgi:class 3 adenylate cyclase/tetratricopeptide (TPR) repeat protein